MPYEAVTIDGLAAELSRRAKGCADQADLDRPVNRYAAEINDERADVYAEAARELRRVISLPSPPSPSDRE